MQELLNKSIEFCRKVRDIIFICYPITIVISGLWLFSYSLFIVKRMLPLPPDLLIYLFLFIPTTVGFIPAFTIAALVYTKHSLKNLLSDELSYKETTFPSKYKVIFTTASILLGILTIAPIIIPAFTDIKRLPPIIKEPLQIIKSASPLLVVLGPSLFTTFTGISYIKHAGKKTTLSLILQLIWLSSVVTIAFLLPSLLSMLFMTKSAVDKMPHIAWLYLGILFIIYIIPFLSPLILSALIQEITRVQKEDSHQETTPKIQKNNRSTLLSILAITMLTMAIPTIKWIIITPLSVAKLGYFEAKIVDKEKKEKPKNILVLWKAGNVILYRDMPIKNEKKNKSTNIIKETQLTPNEEIIIYDKPILNLPAP